MLVLTDREDQSWRLQRDLSFVGPCKAAHISASFNDAEPDPFIISDVATDNADQIDRLREAVGHYRGDQAPFLCLLRKDSYLAKTQAFALGATRTLPHDVSRNTLLETVFDLLTPEGPAEAAPRPSLRTGVRKARIALANMMDAAERGAWIEPKTLSAGTDVVLQAVELNDVNDWLGVVGNYHEHTYQHSLLVAGLAASFSIKLGFGLNDRRRLTKAALLHDIGKAHIPVALLGKPRGLTPAERTLMRTHAAIGYDMLQKQGGFAPELLDVVRHHHECLDGSGYPDGLQGDEITDMVRLVTICDVYAALIERRSYKEPMAPAAAYEIMQGMTGKLDPALLAAFIKVTIACGPAPKRTTVH